MSVKHWVSSNYDNLTAVVTGSVTGVITFPSNYLTSALFSVILALFTGAAGWIGARVAHSIFSKLFPKHKQEQDGQ